MMRMCLAACLVVTACGSYPRAVVEDPYAVNPPGASDAGTYFRDRGHDFGDMLRLGIEIGPGIGADVMVSDYIRFGAMARRSFGMGYQTIRYSPFKDSRQTYVQMGPWRRVGVGYGTDWYINTWDVRAEIHPLIAGAHVAVNPAEIGDFLVGWFTFDPMDDDRLGRLID